MFAGNLSHANGHGLAFAKEFKKNRPGKRSGKPRPAFRGREFRKSSSKVVNTANTAELDGAKKIAALLCNPRQFGKTFHSGGNLDPKHPFRCRWINTVFNAKTLAFSRNPATKLEKAMIGHSHENPG